MSFAVHVKKERFKFNCAHFIAFKGFRERLHGHNYQVGVKLSGKLGNDGYVMDFGDVKDAVIQICKEWNERFICPMKSDVLNIQCLGGNIQIKCEDGTSFSFPQDDCLELPIIHSSAEELAQYFCSLLIQKLTINHLDSRGVQLVEVSVAEAPNQEAIFCCDLASDYDRSTSQLIMRASRHAVNPCGCAR